MNCIFATNNRLLDCEVVEDIFLIYPFHRFSSKNNWKWLEKKNKTGQKQQSVKKWLKVPVLCSKSVSSDIQEKVLNTVNQFPHFFAFCAYMPIINSLLLHIHSSFNLTPLFILRHLKYFKGAIAYQICKPLTWHLIQYQYDSLKV